jgi:SAM-dependent methyltransferase
MPRVEPLLRATALAERRHFWFRGLRFFVRPLLREATKGLSAARILDCGCGTGANLELLEPYGRAYGFDLTNAGLRIGREMGRHRLAQASVDAIPFPSGAFDLVTSLTSSIRFRMRSNRGRYGRCSAWPNPEGTSS